MHVPGHEALRRPLGDPPWPIPSSAGSRIPLGPLANAAHARYRLKATGPRATLGPQMPVGLSKWEIPSSGEDKPSIR